MAHDRLVLLPLAFTGKIRLIKRSSSGTRRRAARH
jgi:hypothetical protein